MRVSRLMLLYTLFAAISTIANLATQMVMVRLYVGSFAIPVSVLAGTAVGLPIKYILDKLYIFRFVTQSTWHDGRLFLIYSVTAMVTTALFWGTEFLLHWLFGTEAMRLLGAVIGLTFGYIIKYRLDARFVFVDRPPKPREYS
jgi:putative flippase GtrA